MNKSETISIRVDPDIKRRLKKAVARKGISISEAIESYLSGMLDSDNESRTIISRRHATIPEIIAAVKETIPLCNCHIERIHLFGSYARGQERDGSDINLYFNISSDPILFEREHISMMLQERLKAHVDIIIGGGLPEEVMKVIRKDRILIYEDESEPASSKVKISRI